MRFSEALEYLLADPKHAVSTPSDDSLAWVQFVPGRDVPVAQIWSERGRDQPTGTHVPVGPSFTSFDGERLLMGWAPSAQHLLLNDWYAVG